MAQSPKSTDAAKPSSYGVSHADCALVIVGFIVGLIFLFGAIALVAGTLDWMLHEIETLRSTIRRLLR